MTPDALRAWRAAHGWSQAALARALGVRSMTVSDWERGVYHVPPYLALALASLSHTEDTRP